MSALRSFDTILDRPAYGLSTSEKQALLLEDLRDLTNWHKKSCAPYNKILNALYPDTHDFSNLADVPYLPVRIFKHQKLSSVAEDQIVKTMTSSGTSGQTPSQIFLDKVTASLQVKILSRIMADFVGGKRLPMLVIDCKATVKDRFRFSARTAGINGFSMFGKDVTFALKDDMSLDFDAIEEFTQKHGGGPVLLFGFTFIIWQHFVLALEELNKKIPLEQGILLHGGGWKKLLDDAVSPQEFNQRVCDVTDVSRNYNYYGMVEQTGSIFMACENGHFHTSAWADIIIRDPMSFVPLPNGETGLIELLSVMPHSYPGHVLLSEDLGTIRGEDDCPCGRKGQYFTVEGRLPKAEIRGCSDTYSR